MEVRKTSLKDLLVIEPKVYSDARGLFMETFHRERYREQGVDVEFVQDNRAASARGVLRGLHFQIQHPQAKLVSVTQGEIYDVAVDLRKESPTYGKWEGFHLSAEKYEQVYIPEGFAHGYCVLSESAEFVYKCSNFYDPEDEGGLIWNDPDLGIEWPISNPILSDKDKNFPRIKDL